MIGARVVIYGSGSAFIGILDTYPSLAGWALRLLKSNYSGGLIYAHAYDGSSHGKADIMPYRSGANYILDLNSTLENLDATALGRGLTTSDTLADLLDVGGSNYNGLTQKIYDQAGSSYDYEQGTTGAQPLFATAGAINTIGGKPCIDFNGTTNYLTLTTPISSNTAWSVFNVQKLNTTNGWGIGGNVAANSYSVWATGGDYYVKNRGGFQYYAGASDANQTLLTSISTNPSDQTTINLYKDSSLQSGSPTIAASSNDFHQLGGNSGWSKYHDGQHQELIFYSSDKSSDRVGIETNINDYFTIY